MASCFAMFQQNQKHNTTKTKSINAICTLFAADLAGGAKPSVRKEEAKPTVELEVKNVLASTPAELALLQNPHMKQGQL